MTTKNLERNERVEKTDSGGKLTGNIKEAGKLVVAWDSGKEVNKTIRGEKIKAWSITARRMNTKTHGSKVE